MAMPVVPSRQNLAQLWSVIYDDMDSLDNLVSYDTNIFPLALKRRLLKDPSQDFIDRYRIIQIEMDLNRKISIF